uniref:LAGLIDADG homing endonuclease n=1 Tax=Lobosphaera incisa TaxID=312850 RepID=A0A0F7DXD5_9CHLO|nr:LAGLIDADG homing endonuclease [Lobosphaera incisa]AKF78649.1 LAGLIDADG homing endonuclease [Lobosphaera incisa]
MLNKMNDTPFKPLSGKKSKICSTKTKSSSFSPLSQEVFEVAIGTVLGDASVQTQNNGKTYRLKFSQSSKHKDYLFDLHEIFRDWVLSPPHFNEKRNMWSFQTKADQEFKKIATLFFDLDPNGSKKKQIMPCIEKYITPRVLAYWFMDDGGKACYNKDFPRKGLVFNTQGFSEDHVIFLVNILKNKYQLNCWHKPNKKGFIIVISGNHYNKWRGLVDPYLHPSMVYKLPLI